MYIFKQLSIAWTYNTLLEPDIQTCMHCKRPGLFNWAWLTQLQLASMHCKMLSHAAREQSGLRSWCSLLEFIQCADLFPLQCAYNVPVCCCQSVSWKLYNVSACYQKLHKCEATWMLVTTCPLVCHQTFPCLSTVSPKNKVYIQ